MLIGNVALASIIREGKTFQIGSFIQGGQAEGMQSLDATLAKLVAAGTVRASDALEKATDKDAFARLPQVAQQLEGEPVS